eukprot:TRINITY_DN2743_c0_g1_i1.p1 TRINITY_DN2743_c0_g1~~TRINITY_DN2743_c0_g1_i1.p1  ORF type:complete len:1095 (+),score=181.45 TRINITY_DN2743_c0_g1_i1:3-3287(+)
MLVLLLARLVTAVVYSCDNPPPPSPGASLPITIVAVDLPETHYRNNMDCSIYLSSPAGNAFEVIINSFETDGSDDLVFYDDSERGAGTLYSALSFASNPPTSRILTLRNYLLIRFRSNNSGTAAAWNITVKAATVVERNQIYVCGEIVTDHTLPITLKPAVQGNYLPNMDCSFTITNPASRGLSVAFSTFSTSDQNDYLDISDGSAVLYHAVTGPASSLGTPISWSDTLHIKFKSGPSGQAPGWILVISDSIAATRPADTFYCGETIPVPAPLPLTLRAVGMPESRYPPDVDCRFVITTTEGYGLVAGLTWTPLVNYDIFRLYDGASDQGTGLLYSSEDPSFNTGIISRGSSVYFKWVSVSFDTTTSWEVVFDQTSPRTDASDIYLCGQAVPEDPAFPIYLKPTLYGSYGNLLDCSWNIHSSQPKLSAMFESYNFDSTDIINVYDGPSRTRGGLLYTSGGAPWDESAVVHFLFQSTGPSMAVHFVSNGATVRSGGVLRVFYDRSNYASFPRPGYYCGDNIVPAPTFPISLRSAGDGSYTYNMNCEFLIPRPADSCSLRITFLDSNYQNGWTVEPGTALFLEGGNFMTDPNASYDLLLPGATIDEFVTNPGTPWLRLTFQTTTSAVGLGWNAQVETLPCTQSATPSAQTPSHSQSATNSLFTPSASESALLESACMDTVPSLNGYRPAFIVPGHDLTYQNNMNCMWLVQSSVIGSGIQVDFSELALEDQFDFLTFYDGSDSTAPLLGSFTGDIWANTPVIPVIVTSGSLLWIHFQSDNSVTQRGFRLRLDTARTSSHGYVCGSAISNPASFPLVIQSNVLGNYAPNMNCSFVVEATGSMWACGLQIKMTRFETQANHDILSVYEGTTLLQAISGTPALPYTFQSIYGAGPHTLRFVFRTDEDTVAAGWRAEISELECTLTRTRTRTMTRETHTRSRTMTHKTRTKTRETRTRTRTMTHQTRTRTRTITRQTPTRTISFMTRTRTASWETNTPTSTAARTHSKTRTKRTRTRKTHTRTKSRTRKTHTRTKSRTRTKTHKTPSRTRTITHKTPTRTRTKTHKTPSRTKQHDVGAGHGLAPAYQLCAAVFLLISVLLS